MKEKKKLHYNANLSEFLDLSHDAEFAQKMKKFDKGWERIPMDNIPSHLGSIYLFFISLMLKLAYTPFGWNVKLSSTKLCVFCSQNMTYHLKGH